MFQILRKLVYSDTLCWKKVEHTEGPHLQFLKGKRKKI